MCIVIYDYSMVDQIKTIILFLNCLFHIFDLSNAKLKLEKLNNMVLNKHITYMVSVFQLKPILEQIAGLSHGNSIMLMTRKFVT